MEKETMESMGRRRRIEKMWSWAIWVMGDKVAEEDEAEAVAAAPLLLLVVSAMGELGCLFGITGFGSWGGSCLVCLLCPLPTSLLFSFDCCFLPPFFSYFHLNIYIYI